MHDQVSVLTASPPSPKGEELASSAPVGRVASAAARQPRGRIPLRTLAMCCKEYSLLPSHPRQRAFISERVRNAVRIFGIRWIMPTELPSKFSGSRRLPGRRSFGSRRVHLIEFRAREVARRLLRYLNLRKK